MPSWYSDPSTAERMRIPRSLFNPFISHHEKEGDHSPVTFRGALRYYRSTNRRQAEGGERQVSRSLCCDKSEYCLNIERFVRYLVVFE